MHVCRVESGPNYSLIGVLTPHTPDRAFLPLLLSVKEAEVHFLKGPEMSNVRPPPPRKGGEMPAPPPS